MYADKTCKLFLFTYLGFLNFNELQQCPTQNFDKELKGEEFKHPKFHCY